MAANRQQSDRQAFDDAVARGGQVILLVDDDPILRNVMLLLLQRSGYAVLVAADGEEAIALSREYGGRVDMLLTDIKMPGMDGNELSELIMSEQPGIRILQVSGYLGEGFAGHNRKLPFLQKPFTPAGLIAKVVEVLNGPPGERKVV